MVIFCMYGEEWVAWVVKVELDARARIMTLSFLQTSPVYIATHTQIVCLFTCYRRW